MTTSGIRRGRRAIPRAAAEAVMRRVRESLDDGSLPLPGSCTACGSPHVVGVGVWIPEMGLQVEFWGPEVSPESPGYAVWGCCRGCARDPDIRGRVAGLFARELTASRRAVPHASN